MVPLLRLLIGLALAVSFLAAVPTAEAHLLRTLDGSWPSDSVPAPDARMPVAPSAVSIAEPPVAVWTAAPDHGRVPLTLLAVVAVLMAAAIRRPRLAVALVLTVAVSVFAFEGPLHSVHHLGDQTAAGHCAVAAVSGQLSGTTVEYVAVDLSPTAASGNVAPASFERLPSRSPRSVRDRAPPALPA